MIDLVIHRPSRLVGSYAGSKPSKHSRHPHRHPHHPPHRHPSPQVTCFPARSGAVRLRFSPFSSTSLPLSPHSSPPSLMCPDMSLMSLLCALLQQENVCVPFTIKNPLLSHSVSLGIPAQPVPYILLNCPRSLVSFMKLAAQAASFLSERILPKSVVLFCPAHISHQRSLYLGSSTAQFSVEFQYIFVLVVCDSKKFLATLILFPVVPPGFSHV